MLDKIQNFSTRLDKKRVYTAIGALVVALATGHVMQRTVGGPNVVANTPAQQAVLSQGVMQAPSVPVEVSESAPELLAEPREASELGDVTKADATPATEPLAPLAEPEVSTPPAALAANASIPQDAGEPEAVAQGEPAEIPSPNTEIATDIANFIPDEPETVAEDEVLLAEVTRAASDEDLPMPQLSQPVYDLSPADVTPSPVGPVMAEDDCAPAFDVSVLPGAMIYVEVTAPCASGAEITFDHSGLRFTETLDETGALNVMVPAMTADASLMAEIAGREAPLTAEISVPDMAEYDRIALVWQGGTGLQLHALEDGATYGDAGHIWAEEPGLPNRASDGEGGYVTVLGSTMGGYAADVYTYPIAMPTAPKVSIEAQVLETTCGGPILGEYLRSAIDGQPTVTQVGMIVPDCEAIGEYLVLKNLPQDLTIARN
jgi:hypothetical protein